METDQDLIDRLIKQTESGELEWSAHLGGGGWWRSGCGDWEFTVQKQDGTVVVAGYGTAVYLKESPDLVTMLQRHKPIATTPTDAEVLKRALECLSEKD